MNLAGKVKKPCNDNVSTSKTKNVKFQLRIDEELRDDFHIAAELQGLKAASLLHQFIVKTVQEAKREYPEAFHNGSSHSQTTTRVSAKRRKAA